MIMTSSAFNGALEGGNRNYQVLASIELLSGETLTLDNTLIWSSGLSLDDSIATTSEALEIGTAIVNKATLIINNMTEQFSAYDFSGAVVTLQVGLKPSAADPVAYINKGTFTVESASYNTTLITLTCIDNMHKFDAVYNSSLTFPSTALTVVEDACTACGVTLGVQTFTGATTAVIAPPEQAVTYRNMLSWIGQLVGCCWRINNAGELMPVWYGLSVLEQFYDGGTFAYNGGADLDGGTFAYGDGDSADGGAFSWTGYFIVIHAASADVAVDDTLVTGVKIQVANTAEDAAEAYTEYTAGTDGYSLVITDNPLITEDNAQSIANTLAGRLVGMKYRKGNVVHVSDPRMEAGDVMVYADHKGHAYPMLVSQVLFTAGEYQTSVSASEPPLRNVGQRYSHSMQTGVSTFQAIARERNAREGAISDLEDELANAPGLYQSSESDGQGGTIYYLHDKPNRANSNIIWKMSSSAVGVSTNGGQSWNAGLTADGTAIVQRLYANAITAGILKSNDYQYTSGTYTTSGMIVDLDNQTIRAMYAAILGDGKLYAKGGTVGGWTIGSTDIHYGRTGSSYGNGSGIYIGQSMISLSNDSTYCCNISGSGTVSLDVLSGSLSPFVIRNSPNGVASMTTCDIGYASLTFMDTDSNDNLIIPVNLVNVSGAGMLQLQSASSGITMDCGGGGAGITFTSPKDAALIANYYNNVTYNILRNHNNGDISVSASGGALYLGYENTTSINFLNGNATLSSSGALTCASNILSGGDVYSVRAAGATVGAEISTTANGIFIQALSDGTAQVTSRGANGTWYNILRRANNSSAITAYGDWMHQGHVVVQAGKDIRLSAASGSDDAGDLVYYNGAGTEIGRVWTSYANSVGTLNFRTTGSTTILSMTPTATNAYGTWTFSNPIVNPSDIRLKENVKDSSVNALDAINSIPMREFDWKDDGHHQSVGIIADELEKVDPGLVRGGGEDENGTPITKGIDAMYMIGYLTKAIQELSAKVEQLEARVKELEEKKDVGMD